MNKEEAQFELWARQFSTALAQLSGVADIMLEYKHGADARFCMKKLEQLFKECPNGLPIMFEVPDEE